MPIVFACAASHAPGMTAWTEAAPKEQADNFLDNYHKLGSQDPSPMLSLRSRSNTGPIFF